MFEEVRGPILVTGAGGFIGRNLMRALLSERTDVTGTVRHLTRALPEEFNISNFATGDLSDTRFRRYLFENFKPATVIHAASYGNSPHHKDIAKIYETNLVTSTLLVDEALRAEVGAFINLGTSSEYGWNSSAPAEDTTCAPNSHYAVAKRAFTEVLQKMFRESGFPAITLRLYSVYGPFENSERLIPKALVSAHGGDLVKFANRDISRDFVFVDDVIAAIAIAAQKAPNPESSRIFNIGTGVKTTLEDFAMVLRETFDLSEAPHFGAYQPRAWDLTDWVSNPELAARELGWSATISLPDGLKATSEWLRSVAGEVWSNSQVVDFQTPPLDSHNRKSVSAVVACYKDELAIDEMHTRLSAVLGQIGCRYEIIFVNDGSPDATEEKIRQISAGDPHVKGLTHSRNFGSQMAFLSGMEMAEMDSVVLLDGDLQDPPEIIKDFYDQWLSGFDVVYGVRSSREMGRLQEAPYRAFYRVNRWLSGGRIPVDAGDFSLISREVVNWILASPESDFLVRGIRAYVGFKQTGVAYFRPKRKYGSSTNSFLSNVGWAKKAFFSFSEKPLSMITNSGFVMLFLGFLGAGYTFLLRVLSPDHTPDGVTTILISILIFGALNLFAVGIIGEYVGKIMVEVKRRPKFIRHHRIQSGKISSIT